MSHNKKSPGKLKLIVLLMAISSSLSFVGHLTGTALGTASYGSTDASETQDPALLEMAEYLNNLPSIRVVITQASGNGHQAATVNVMRRLRQIGFRGNFEVVFDNKIRGKLDLLLPGFNSAGADIQTIDFLDGMTVMSEEYFLRNGPRTPLPLGITGADDLTIKSSQQFRVEAFLKLQPMDWQQPSEVLIGTNPIALDDLKKLGLVIDPPSPKTLEAELAEMNNLPHLGRKIEGLRLLFGVSDKSADVMPMYGVGLNGIEKIVLVVKALRQLQSGPKKVLKKSVVIPVVSNLNDRELDQLRRQLPPNILHIGSIDDPATLERLREPKAGEIVLLLTGSVTQSIFNRIFSKATLPATVAGKNATDLVQQLGKPYINVMGTLPLGPQLDALDIDSHGLVTRTFKALDLAHSMDPRHVETVAEFIKASIAKKSPLGSFFKSLQESRQGLAQDKVFQGLVRLRKWTHGYTPLLKPRTVNCPGVFGGN